MNEIDSDSSNDNRFCRFTKNLHAELHSSDESLRELHARRLMGKLAVSLQASLLYRHAPNDVAEMFVAARMGDDGPTEMETLNASHEALSLVVQRAVPDPSVAEVSSGASPSKKIVIPMVA
ncbi:MAG: hypothetical protein NVSMB34_07680 [Variovorax sp.]